MLHAVNDTIRIDKLRQIWNKHDSEQSNNFAKNEFM